MMLMDPAASIIMNTLTLFVQTLQAKDANLLCKSAGKLQGEDIVILAPAKTLSMQSPVQKEQRKC